MTYWFGAREGTPAERDRFDLFTVADVPACWQDIRVPAVYWPAMLMAAGLPRQDRLVTAGSSSASERMEVSRRVDGYRL